MLNTAFFKKSTIYRGLQRRKRGLSNLRDMYMSSRIALIELKKKGKKGKKGGGKEKKRKKKKKREKKENSDGMKSAFIFWSCS